MRPTPQDFKATFSPLCCNIPLVGHCLPGLQSTKQPEGLGVKRIQALVERQARLDGPAGVDTGGPHQAWQQRPRDDGAVKQRAEERNLKTSREQKETMRRA